jgi:hypothetical protein
VGWFAASEYFWSRLVFQRALAVIYLLAFVNAAGQFRALLGSHGITPIPRFVARRRFRDAPSAFHAFYSDRFFACFAVGGALLAAATLGGLTDVIPLWAAMLVWALLWVGYLSIVNVGQVWYGFGWESLLAETGFLAIFLGNAQTAAPVLIVWLFRWLLFRVEFGAGLIKIRGDPCWRNLTCLDYHHETQPMPGPTSRFFHHRPPLVHRVEVASNHLTQLIVPFALFTPQPVATIAAAIVVVTQGWLLASGNFAWLNVLTMILAVPALDLPLFTGLSHPANLSVPLWFVAVVIAASALIVALSYRPARNMISPRQVMNTGFDPLRLVNSYGAFGHVTKARYEVIIEGTPDPEIGAATPWSEYEFKGKPGDVFRRPPQIAPYHLRLDWLMWFAALSPAMSRGWFRPLIERLLENEPDTLKLLRTNPFPEAPPKFVRARLYRYWFATRAEHRSSGAWWHRELVGEYLPAMGRDQVARHPGAN